MDCTFLRILKTIPENKTIVMNEKASGYVISVRTEGIPPSTNDMIVGDSTMRSTTRQEKSDIFLVMT